MDHDKVYEQLRAARLMGYEVGLQEAIGIMQRMMGNFRGGTALAAMKAALRELELRERDAREGGADWTTTALRLPASPPG